MTDELFYREKGGHIDNAFECLIKMVVRVNNDADTVWLQRSARM
jgi:hypothetical protein